MKAKEKLAKLRRRLPGLEVEGYALLDAVGEKVALSSFFGEKDELISCRREKSNEPSLFVS